MSSEIAATFATVADRSVSLEHRQRSKRCLLHRLQSFRLQPFLLVTADCVFYAGNVSAPVIDPALLQPVLDKLDKISDATTAMLVHSIVSDRQAARLTTQSHALALQSHTLALTLACVGSDPWHQGFQHGHSAGEMRREYGQGQSPSYKDDPTYKSGYAAGYKISSQVASRVPTASELDTASKQALAEDTTISVSTIASYGLTKYAPIKWALSEGAALVLGDSAPEIPIATSSGALTITITLASGDLPAGLNLEGCKLTGVVASVRAYRFTLRAVQAVPGDAIDDERTFGHAGVRAAGGYAGLPCMLGTSQHARQCAGQQ